MSRLITWTSLIAVLALVAMWNWSFMHFMYQQHVVVVWVAGFTYYVIKPAFLWSLILYASYVAGRVLVRDWLVATVLGLGILGTLAWFVSLLQILDLWVIQGTVLGLCFFGAYRCDWSKWGVSGRLRAVFDSLRGWDWQDKLFLAVIAWWVGRTVLLAFNPSIGFDSIHAHLWQNKNMIEAGGYVAHPFHTNFALGHSITLLLQKMGVGDPCAIVQYTAMLIAAGFLYRIGCWLGDRTTGLLATLLFLIQPVTFFVSLQWFAGPIMLMFLAGAGWILVRGWGYLRLMRKGWPWGNMQARGIDEDWEDYMHLKFGILLGFAIATKLSCAPLVLLLIILAGKHWWRVCLWLAVAVVPFLGVNFVVYGNPFYPFRHEWFAFIPWANNPETLYYARPVLPDTWMTTNPNWLANFWYNNSPIARAGEMTIAGPWALALTIPLLVVWKQWTKPIKVLIVMTVLLYCYWAFAEQVFHARYMNYVFCVHLLLGSWAITKVMKS